MSNHLTFAPDEFQTRIVRLRRKLRELDLAAGLFDEIEAMTWLSGYGNSENRWRCVVVPVEAEPFFLIRALDAGPCRSKSWITAVPSYRDWEDPFPLLADWFARSGLSEARVGLDFGSYCMPVGRFERLKSCLPKVKFIDLGPLISELRLIKSEAELAKLRQAAEIADRTMLQVAEICRPGKSQRDVALMVSQAAMELGADPARPGPISAGKGWDFLHAHLEDKPLTKGDIVHVELTPSVDGYSARLMRCVSVGPIDPALASTAERLAVLQDAQIAAMKPGVEARAIDRILRDGVLSTGLRDSFDNITGYTLGLYAPAGPRTSDFTRIFHPHAHWRLEADMVFHMYVSAGGVSFSETVLVSDDGPIYLTKLPRNLMQGG
jgi:Xaa-Pro aminopeptidase